MAYRRMNQYPRSTTPVTVYLLHFSKKLGHAQHYIGVTTRGNVEERLSEHRSGRGARLCAAAVQGGAELQLARTWENVPRFTEVKLKNRGGAGRLCPVCKEEKNARLRCKQLLAEG